MNATAPLLGLVAAFAVAAVLTPLVRTLAQRRNLVAHPHDERWHPDPVPVLGGYAIAAAFALITVAAAPLAPLAPLLVGTGLMFGLGALDDRLHFRASTKLVAQTIIAAVVVYLLPAVTITGFPPVDQLLALGWIVGISNAFNLLDNIDGLSGGIAAIAGLFFLAGVAPLADTPLVVATAAFVGAALGFLVFNARPASIFMGDSGSLFLGSFLAIAALIAMPAQPSRAVAVAVPLFMLLVPIFDTAFVSITRGLAGRSPMLGGRDHLSHRLVAFGFDERWAVIALYLLAALGGGVALSLQRIDSGYAAIVVTIQVILLAIVAIVLWHVDVRKPSAEHGLAPSQPLVSEVAYQNRVYEVVLDIALIGLAYLVAFRLRFPGPEFADFLGQFGSSFPLVIACQMAGLAIAGKYRQMWRNFGAGEVMGIAQGTFMGVAASALLMLYLPYRFQGFSRLVFVIDAVALLFLLVGSRLAITTADEYLRRRRGAGRRILIYGAGARGALLVRTLLEDPTHGLVPVGFIDDDHAKRRLRLEGIPVVGSFETLDTVFARRGVAELIVSIRAVDRVRLGEIAAICRDRGVAIRSMRFAIEEIGPVPSVRHAQGR